MSAGSGEASGRQAPAADQPLAGTLVVDLTRHLPGPLAGRLLADLGARVIKVEEPALGDPVRLAPPMAGGTGALAGILLGGVDSVALDLRRAPARELLERLLARADVLLESFRPGALSRLGLDVAELRRRHPGLVVCSISGWGQDGPMAARAGHDLTYQAVSGALASVPRAPAVPVADLTGAWSAVGAVLAALLRRERGGGGCWIDAALGDAAVHANLVAWAEEAGGARSVGDSLLLAGGLPCYRVYRTADGHPLAVAALERKFWLRLCAVLERRDLRRKQYDRAPAAHAAVAAAVASRCREEWEEIAEREDLPVAVLLAPADAAEHPQLRHRGVVGKHPGGGYRLAFPARFDGLRPPPGGDVPTLGAATGAVLEEVGAAEELRPSRESGIGPRRSLRRWLARFAPRLP